jgi:16S rRNA processing protein RimM
MLKEDCFFLGTIVGKYSFKGEILLKLDTDTPSDYTDLNSLFVATSEGLVPYFIDQCRLHKSALLRIKFEGVDSESDASELIKKEVYLPLNMLAPLEDDKFYYHEVIDFYAIADDGKSIGRITAVNDAGPQALFVIDSAGTEILIPVHDNFIKKLDKKNKKIHFELPEGLLDIFK